MSERTYYQIPIAMTVPVEVLLDRRIKALKEKCPEAKYISRARLGLGSIMWLLVQDDKVVLEMLELATVNMELCRKAK